MKRPTTEPSKGGVLFPICLVLASSLFSLVSLYARNVSNIRFRYALPFFLAFAALGIVVWLFCCPLLKHRGRAALMTAWLMAIFCNFGLLDLVFPGLRSAGITRAMLVCAGVCILVSLGVFLVLRRLKPDTVQVLTSVFALVFTVLVLSNAATGLVSGLQAARENRDRMSTPDGEAIVQAAEQAPEGERPNFYFILFDEYAGVDELAEYYHFDNSAFTDYLESQGFTVARGCTNEMVDTMYILADLSNLQFLHPKGYQEDVLRYQLRNGVWFDVMEALGYQVLTPETEGMTEGKNPVPGLHTVSVPQTQTGDSYIKAFLYNTAVFFLYDNVERWVLNSPTNHPDSVNLVMDYLGNMTTPTSPTFFFCYVSSPHGAFFFDKDGNRIDTPDDPYDNFNWTDQSIYLGQLEYVNLRAEQAVDNILAQDPNSIIILCSDHGARNHEEYGNADVTDFQALDILMAVYDRGRPVEGLDGMDGVNVLRTILNRTYGMDLPMQDYWPDGHTTETVGRAG